MNSLNKTESTVFVCAVSLNLLIMNSLNKTESTVFVFVQCRSMDCS